MVMVDGVVMEVGMGEDEDEDGCESGGGGGGGGGCGGGDGGGGGGGGGGGSGGGGGGGGGGVGGFEIGMSFLLASLFAAVRCTSFSSSSVPMIPCDGAGGLNLFNFRCCLASKRPTEWLLRRMCCRVSSAV